MSVTKWRKSGRLMLSKSGKAVNVWVNDKLNSVKISDVQEVMEGKRRYAELSTSSEEEAK